MTADERWAIKVIYNIVTENWDDVDIHSFDELRRRIRKVNFRKACIEFDTFTLQISALEEYKHKKTH